MKTALKIVFSDKTNISKYVSNQFKHFNIKQEESVFVVEQSTELGRRFNPKNKKENYKMCDF